MLKKTLSRSKLSPVTLDKVKIGVILPGREQAQKTGIKDPTIWVLASALTSALTNNVRNEYIETGSCTYISVILG